MWKQILPLLFLSNISWAQTRYYDAVFSDVLITSDVVYGQNTSVLAFPFLIKDTLIMDIYQPAGDTETARPVALYLHTGNLFPFISPIDGMPGFNGACAGTRSDSAVVEICSRLAKMGYVACAVDYRLGWNSFAATEVGRRYNFLHAVYRAIQDVRTSIRFLRKSVAESGNPWGIDPEKIVVWGDGTGGTIAMNAIFLDNYDKIPSASQGKFLWDHDSDPGTPTVSMINPEVHGDIWGTSIGIDSITADTLCFINHAGYSSGFSLGVNLGGACLDTAWIDPGQPPLISFHVPYDRNAPYAESLFFNGHFSIILLQGSYTVQHFLQDFPNNQSFSNIPHTDLQNEQILAFSNTPVESGNDWTDFTPGLYPLNTPLNYSFTPPLPENAAPWQWSGVVPNNPTCNTNKAAAIPYIDTIIRFTAPRACFVLGLQGCIDQIVAQDEPIAKHIQVTAAPNPSANDVLFSTATDQTIQALEVYDMHGRMVRSIRDINNNTYTLQRNSLPNGIFVAKLYFKEGVQALRFVLE